MPHLSEKYGLLPWHFGGPEHLTDAEIESYLKHYHEARKKEAAAAKKSPKTASSPRRSRR